MAIAGEMTVAAGEDSKVSFWHQSDQWVENHQAELKEINQFIWSHPEVGLEERQAAERLIRFAEENGFKVERGVAGMPTAFVAEKGSGRPIIAILAEYDALPGMSQSAVPERKGRGDENDAGHACGHSLFGTASAGAAAAAAAVATRAGWPGTIRLYGTPAEETLIGKVFMTEADFARKTLDAGAEAKALSDSIEPLGDEPGRSAGSTDVGNISWTVPTGGIRVACYTLGAPSHSWQIVACGGTTIGEKGMLVAAKTLASATLELLADSRIRAEAKEDFERRRAKLAALVSVLAPGQRAPPSIR